MKTTRHKRQERQAQPKGPQAQGTKRTTGHARQRRTVRPSFWRRQSTWIVGGVILLAIIVGGVVFTRAQPGEIAGVVTYSNLSREHVNGPVTYPQIPPVGGPHNPNWLNCGIYDQPVPNENAVHSLEHGAVWITYRPTLDAGSIAQLQQLLQGHSYAILSPYPGLPAPIVISAWGVQLRVQSTTDPRLAQFLSTYEQGPQTPEPGAPCSGGVGTPIGQ